MVGISRCRSTAADSGSFSNASASASSISGNGATLHPASICARRMESSCAFKIDNETARSGKAGNASSPKAVDDGAEGMESDAFRHAQTIEKKNTCMTVRYKTNHYSWKAFQHLELCA